MTADNWSAIRCGIAGWIDKELIGSRQFSPPGVSSWEERLRWVARTPPGFVFDVKSFSLFTQHPTSPGRYSTES